jgi:hypothetical protein
MKKTLIDLGGQAVLMGLASYGRAAPRSSTAAQRAQIARTVGRAPEVMAKVSGGARTLNGVGAHLAYIGREDFEVETDMGERIHEKRWVLLEDWDLDN